MDAWYTPEKTQRERVRREWPQHFLLRLHPILSGLWRDADLLTPDGRRITVRIYF